MDRLIKTILLIEDRRFNNHHGIDFLSILRAIVVNITEKRFAQGGSTITQQLARTLYLYTKKTLTRKFIEVIISFYLELKYSKKEILNKYIKEIYMGHTKQGPIKGLHRASIYYFNKPLDSISVSEEAALVAMIKGPNLYKINSNVGIGRRIMVLGKMLEEGLIDNGEFFRASRERLTVS